MSSSDPKIDAREGSKRGEGDRGEHAARRLQLQRPHEEPAELPPLLADDVAEAELRQRLLDGEIEQHLEEPDHDDRGRVEAEVLETEHARGHDGAQNSEDDGPVHPRGRRRTAPEDAGGHRRVSLESASE